MSLMSTSVKLLIILAKVIEYHGMRELATVESSSEIEMSASYPHFENFSSRRRPTTTCMIRIAQTPISLDRSFESSRVTVKKFES